ncbi:MAG: hypothetical protein OEV94_09780 [Deltaproteobacteria bacterium]|nr:hypothetical protein [Deltaproteobacteria bacterium]
MHPTTDVQVVFLVSLGICLLVYGGCWVEMVRAQGKQTPGRASTAQGWAEFGSELGWMAAPLMLMGYFFTLWNQ